MENKVTKEELDEVIAKCNFVPASRKVLLTFNSIEIENDVELVSDEMTINDWQYVIANGKNSEYKAGTTVYLDLNKLVKRQPNPSGHGFIEKIDIQPFPLNGKAFVLLDDSVIAGHMDESEQPDLKV